MPTAKKRKRKIHKRARIHNTFTGTLFFILLVLGIGIVIYKYFPFHDIKGASTANPPLQAGILQLEYYPKDPANPNYLDWKELGVNSTDNWTLTRAQELVTTTSQQLLQLVTDATKYHGYKDTSAPTFIQYSIVAKKQYFQKMPRGHKLNTYPPAGIYRPDYGKILTDVNVCDYVDNKNVKEVWIFGYHSQPGNGGIEPDESKLSSKYGDISNASPKDQDLPASESNFRIPICKNSYTMYNYNYPTGGLANDFHDRLHQIENIIPFAENNWPPTLANTGRGKSIFWGNFSEYIPSNIPHNYKSSCGNSHYTPNWQTVTSAEYNYNLQNYADNNCETWHPDASKTTYANASCTQWGCTDVGFYTWLLQNIPGYNNCITHKGKYMRNWWEAMYDFNGFIGQGKTLFTTTNNCQASPTIPLSPTSSSATSTSATDIPVPTYTPTPTLKNTEKDLSGDGKVTIADYKILVNCIQANSNSAACKLADLNGDGKINTIDLITLIRLLRK